MKKHDKIFIVLLSVSSLMMVGIMTENIRSVVASNSPGVKIDVAKVKGDLERAGLVPFEAKYWKVLFKK